MGDKKKVEIIGLTLFFFLFLPINVQAFFVDNTTEFMPTQTYSRFFIADTYNLTDVNFGDQPSGGIEINNRWLRAEVNGTPMNITIINFSQIRRIFILKNTSRSPALTINTSGWTYTSIRVYVNDTFKHYQIINSSGWLNYIFTNFSGGAMTKLTLEQHGPEICLTDLYKTNCSADWVNLYQVAYPALYNFTNGPKTFTANDTARFSFNNKSIEVLDAIMNITNTSNPVRDIQIDIGDDGNWDAWMGGELVDIGKMWMTGYKDIFGNYTHASTNLTDGFGIIYLKLYPYANFTTMQITLNATGLNYSEEYAENNWWESFQKDNFYNPQYAYDGNWSTSAYFDGSGDIGVQGNTTVYENWTVSSGTSVLTWNVKGTCASSTQKGLHIYWDAYDYVDGAWEEQKHIFCFGNAGIFTNSTDGTRELLTIGSVGGPAGNFINSNYEVETRIRTIYTGGTGSGDINIYETNLSYDTYPEDVEIDSLNDGTNESYISVLSAVNVKNLNITGIEFYLRNNTDQAYVEVPIGIYASNTLNITIANVSINYTVWNITLNLTAIQQRVSSNRTIPIRINFTGGGNLKVQDLFVPYKGAGNMTIFAYEAASNFSRLNNYSLEVYWSNFSITMPTNVYYPEFLPTVENATNVTPWGQDAATPIFNITALNYKTAMNVSFYVNESYDTCVNITVSTTNDKNDGWKLNTTKTSIFKDLGWNESGAIWLWADLNASCTGRWIDWYPEFMSCCTTCNQPNRCW